MSGSESYTNKELKGSQRTSQKTRLRNRRLGHNDRKEEVSPPEGTSKMGGFQRRPRTTNERFSHQKLTRNREDEYLSPLDVVGEMGRDPPQMEEIAQAIWRLVSTHQKKLRPLLAASRKG